VGLQDSSKVLAHSPTRSAITVPTQCIAMVMAVPLPPQAAGETHEAVRIGEEASCDACGAVRMTSQLSLCSRCCAVFYCDEGNRSRNYCNATLSSPHWLPGCQRQGWAAHSERCRPSFVVLKTERLSCSAGEDVQPADPISSIALPATALRAADALLLSQAAVSSRAEMRSASPFRAQFMKTEVENCRLRAELKVRR
jgi:hypothetical protein